MGVVLPADHRAAEARAAIGLLAVLRHVQAHDLILLRHADPDEQVRDLEEHEGPDSAENPRRQNGLELRHQERRVPVDQAVLAGAVHRGPGEDARRQRAPGAAHAVHAHHVERVVVAELRLQVARGVAQRAGHDADQDRRERRHEAGRRGDRDETRHGAGGDPEHRGFPAREPLRGHPAERRGGRGRVRGHEGGGGQGVRRDGAARVEPEPAHPQKRSAKHCKGQVVGRHRLMAVPAPLSEHDAGHERADPRGDVHDRAAREVERAPLRADPAAAPHPVAEWRVDERAPEEHEDHVGLELDPLRDRAADERRRDDREHELEHHERVVRDRRRESVRLVGHSVQAQPRERAEEPLHVRSEGDRVAVEHPRDRDQGRQEEAVHEGRQHVLPADEPAVEERETWYGHHEHERGRGEHPRGVAGVVLGGFLRGPGQSRQERQGDRAEPRGAGESLQKTSGRDRLARAIGGACHWTLHVYLRGCRAPGALE